MHFRIFLRTVLAFPSNFKLATGPIAVIASQKKQGRIVFKSEEKKVNCQEFQLVCEYLIKLWICDKSVTQNNIYRNKIVFECLCLLHHCFAASFDFNIAGKAWVQNKFSEFFQTIIILKETRRQVVRAATLFYLN